MKTEQKPPQLTPKVDDRQKALELNTPFFNDLLVSGKCHSDIFKFDSCHSHHTQESAHCSSKI